MNLFQKSNALFSPCRRWRFTLERIWDDDVAALNFIMLNPSTADENANDPTVERCERRARAMGFGGVIVTNAYAWRSTDPHALRTVEDPVGVGNDAAINLAARRAGMVICGWGKHCDAVQRSRSTIVLGLLRAAGAKPMALAVNGDGSPKHPLYVGYAATPLPFGGRG